MIRDDCGKEASHAVAYRAVSEPTLVAVSAIALCQRLDRLVRGDRKVFSIARVPADEVEREGTAFAYAAPQTVITGTGIEE
jgi:hypothetical protein